MPDLSNLLPFIDDNEGGGDELQDYIDMIRQLVEQVEEGAPARGQGAWAEPAWRESVMSGLQSEGMDPATYARAKNQIAQGVGAMTGSTASDRAKKGYVSRESMDQFMAGAPATAAATGLANLEATKAQMAQRQREAARAQLTSQLGYLTNLSNEPREAFGDTLGDYMNMMPRVVPFWSRGGGYTGGGGFYGTANLPGGNINRIVNY